MMGREPGDTRDAETRSPTTDELEAVLAAQSLAAGNPTGWFEALYSAGEAGHVAIPWSRQEAHPLLVEWATARAAPGTGKRAIVVGCGLGADAEFIRSLGYDTTAFDISPTAIRQARHRHPSSAVDYTTADLLYLPKKWERAFDLVVEVITVQALPDPPRRNAIVNVGRLVGEGGVLVVVEWATPPEGGPIPPPPPWPLQRSEIELFAADGLDIATMELLTLPEEPYEHRWRVECYRGNPARVQPPGAVEAPPYDQSARGEA